MKGTRSLIDALRSHLVDGSALTHSEVSAWSGALDDLQGSGDARDRLEAFASRIGLEHRRRGKPPATRGDLLRRANAVEFVDRLRHEGLSREAALEKAAEKIGNRTGRRITAASIAKWYSDEDVRRVLRSEATFDSISKPERKRGRTNREK
jgi:hypothetical protein